MADNYTAEHSFSRRSTVVSNCFLSDSDAVLRLLNTDTRSRVIARAFRVSNARASSLLGLRPLVALVPAVWSPVVGQLSLSVSSLHACK